MTEVLTPTPYLTPEETVLALLAYARERLRGSVHQMRNTAERITSADYVAAEQIEKTRACFDEIARYEAAVRDLQEKSHQLRVKDR